MEFSLLMDTQLGSGPGSGESGLSCWTGLQHNTHRAFPLNNDAVMIWLLSSEMDNSHGQLEILILPLSFGLAVMFPRQSGFRGREPLLSLLTHIHRRANTFTETHWADSWQQAFHDRIYYLKAVILPVSTMSHIQSGRNTQTSCPLHQTHWAASSRKDFESSGTLHTWTEKKGGQVTGSVC